MRLKPDVQRPMVPYENLCWLRCEFAQYTAEQRAVALGTWWFFIGQRRDQVAQKLIPPAR